jgi:hypothetical protein
VGHLSRKQSQELVDVLRKSFLYQTPVPIFAKPEDELPSLVQLKMPRGLFERMITIIRMVGGWTLPPEVKVSMLKAHEEAARRALNNGTDYDFSHLEYGELVHMVEETKGIEELKTFHEALTAEVARRGAEARGEVADG